jgi:uridine kinase
MNNTKVVAISGVSGAGKTTIVKLLADEFNCPFLLFDDHIDKDTYPLDMKVWLKNGANVSLIKTPKLVDSLESLISKSSTRFIFIEEPFGKERDSMSSLIDYVILLDQPLELCLARIINRHTENPSENSISSISKYLNKYSDYFRDIYITSANQVRDHSDLIFKDVVSIQNTTSYIGNWLKNKDNYQIS